MNKNEISDELLKGLTELEESGDIVITHTNPELLAKKLSSAIVEKWAFEFLDTPPDVVVIDEYSNTSKQYLCQTFDLSEKEAGASIVDFIDLLSSSRSLREVADLVSHQGYQEIAFGAYYCSHLKRGEYYSSGYLDWRKEINAGV